jgi:hypothetical protein
MSLEEAERHLRDGSDKKALQKLWLSEAQDRLDPVRLERARAAAETVAARTNKRRRRKEALELRELFSSRLRILEQSAAGLAPAAPSLSSPPLTASQVTKIRRISAALFAAAALTVFLPYFAVERVADISTGAPAHTYRYSGVALISGSYKNKDQDAEFYANDGRHLPFMILILAAIGLATVWLRRDKAMAWILLALCIVLFIGGCAATFDLDFFGGGFRKHIEVGFILGVLLLIAATIVRFVLWRIPKEADAVA